MPFLGRSRELGTLRSLMDRREASIILVSGAHGVGKSALVERAVQSFRAALLLVPPIPDQAIRRHLASAMRGVIDDRETSGEDWDHLLEGLIGLADSTTSPFVVVLDDAHRLEEARARYLRPLTALVMRARQEERPLHIVLVSASGHLPRGDGVESIVGGEIRVGPLPFRSAVGLLPGSSPVDHLRAYAVFGGFPRALGLMDRSVTLETNIKRLFLDRSAPLSEVGRIWLERDVQAPARYHAILGALAFGESEWGRIRERVPEVTTGAQLAPYLRRLEELDLVQPRAALDARPNSRTRRYALTDPLLAFWARFLLVRSHPGASDGTEGAYRQLIRPHLDAHCAQAFPEVCRQYMANDASELLASNAREVGSLWGHGYDLPVAGILSAGAPFYGHCHWGAIPRTGNALEELDQQIHETRYGFGREHRLRILFLRDDPPRWLQRDIARSPLAYVITARQLAGADD